jgi:hypothetical protein
MFKQRAQLRSRGKTLIICAFQEDIVVVEWGIPIAERRRKPLPLKNRFLRVFYVIKGAM